MGYADKDNLHIPYQSWAKDRDIEGGDLDFENWKELQRWADRLEGGGGLVAVIDAGDNQVITGYTKRFYIQEERVLNAVTGALEGAGTTNTEARVLRSGYLLGTLTILAGQTAATITLNEKFPAGSWFQIQQTIAGAGAVGPTYYGDFT